MASLHLTDNGWIPELITTFNANARLVYRVCMQAAKSKVQGFSAASCTPSRAETNQNMQFAGF